MINLSSFYILLFGYAGFMSRSARHAAVRQSRLLNLVLEPDRRLHLKSESVNSVTDEIRNLMDDMLFTMYYNQGVGLAAVQVGVLKRVVVIDVGGAYKKEQWQEKNNTNQAKPWGEVVQPLFMANPEITEQTLETAAFREGCLSFPGVYAEVMRPSSIKVRYLDYGGLKQEITVPHSLLSVCIQHEIDHTNGIVFVDHLSRLKRDMLLKKLKKMQERQAED